MSGKRPTLRSPIHRTASVISPLTVFAFLCSAQVAQAHPQINITTTAAGGGFCPFYLWWNTTGNASWPNYIFTELYDSNGNMLAGYPQEDPNIYYIPAAQIHQPATATGQEPDNPSGASTVVISVSGQWNGDSSNPEPVGEIVQPPGRIRLASYSTSRPLPFSALTPMQMNSSHAAQARQKGRSPKPILTVKATKRALGAHNQEIWLSVTNPTSQNAVMHFAYGVFKTPDPDNVGIVPIPYLDATGSAHAFRRLSHAGATRYLIPPSSSRAAGTGDEPTVVKDLRLDLSKSKDVRPTDYVYVDVFVVDNTNRENYALERIQLQP